MVTMVGTGGSPPPQPVALRETRAAPELFRVPGCVKSVSFVLERGQLEDVCHSHTTAATPQK